MFFVEKLRQRKIRFRITVVAGVLIIIGAMVISTVSMILSVARRSAEETAENIFDVTSGTAKERTVSLLQPALGFSTVTAFVPGIDEAVVGNGLDHPARKVFTRMLKNQPSFYSAYIGFPDNSFFMLINADGNPLITEAHSAPEETDIIVRTITGRDDERVQTWSFLDASGEIIGQRAETEFTYDPTQRPWYIAALEFDEAVLTKPYVFNSLKKPGITASSSVPGETAVIGIDLTISDLTEFVTDQYISENGGIALLTRDLEAIALSPHMEEALEVVSERGIGSGSQASQATVLIDELLVRTEVWSVAVNQDLIIVTSAPLDDFMRGAVEMRRRILILSSIILLVTVPFVVFWAARLSKALTELTKDSERVGRMSFDGELTVSTPIYEFHQLAQAFGVMKATIAERTRQLEEANMKLEMLVDMAIAMSAEFDINKLSEMILSNAKKLTHADGGSLYLANEARDKLEFMIVLNDTLGFKQGGTSGTPVTMMPVDLYDSQGNENHKNVVTHIFHSERTENIADAYKVGEYDFSGTRKFDEKNGYRSVSFLTVPLKPRGGGDILGALQLINAMDPETGRIRPFPESYQTFVEALSSAAAVAVQNWKLLERQKQLFDDLVRFIASAIDAKSQYTARHCARVPAIARLLAREAEKVQSGPLADFRFENADEQRQFEISAWLHDCGKVTTPEFVVDKATKLETIYNRIHEIRTRFEVLLRDALIEKYEAVLAGEDRSDAERRLSEKQRQLQEDFEFVAECNIGSEYMQEDNLERLKRIASIRWLRHFDDRIGLSWSEIRRCAELDAGAEAVSLPVEERLLADKPEHILPRENWTEERYRKHGFKFDVPEHLYNRGEFYNLSIRTGTLTEEERFKIDEHVAQTIVLLEHIPFPDNLKKVPEFAGNHHEALDGSGYPRNLSGPEISMPARILAIADIFEALTSTDRPYKRNKTLSEAIDILYQLKTQSRIDPDLFDLLLTSGAYRVYALAFLDAEQIDDVDISKYVKQ